MKSNRKIAIKALGVLLCACVLLAAIVACVSCDGEGSYQTVSTKQELLAMRENKSYRLTADVDLGGALWKPLKLKSFDGGGHTISNCLITETVEAEYDNCIAFFSRIQHLKNVTFDNITVHGNNLRSAAVAVADIDTLAYGNAATIENVTVKNSEIVTSSASDYGPYVGFVVGLNVDTDRCEIRNCRAENSTINCTAASGKACVGGIVGYNVSRVEFPVSSCTVSDCTLQFTATKSNVEINLGGIGGQVEGPLTKCFATGNKIHAIRNADSEYAMRVGGVVGHCYDEFRDRGVYMTRCASVNNELICYTYRNYSLGGVVGRCDGETVNCLSDANALGGSISGYGNSANIGGLCGVAYGAIRTSVAQGCTIYGPFYSNSPNVHTAGFVGLSEGTISSCAVLNNDVVDVNCDVFTAFGAITNCWIFGMQTLPSANQLQVLDNLNRIIDELALDTGYWQQDAQGRLGLSYIGAEDVTVQN